MVPPATSAMSLPGWAFRRSISSARLSRMIVTLPQVAVSSVREKTSLSNFASLSASSRGASGEVVTTPEASSPALADLFPQAILSKLDLVADPLGLTAQASPAVLLSGLVVDQRLLSSTVPIWASKGVTSVEDVTVLLRPSVICAHPGDPSAPLVLVTPSFRSRPSASDPTGQPVVSDLAQLRAKLGERFGRTPDQVKVVEGCLPPGTLGINLVYATGQAWSLPNEAGVCQAPQEVDDGAGRVVHLATGHSIKGVSHPTWQQIFARSVRYAAGEDWSSKVIKCAAIGYGGAFNMGRTHLESCKKARLTPVAVCDVDPLRTATAKAELGEHIQTFNSVERMLAESDADLVTVITPHNLHAPLSLQVLKSGRHVVTEKPYTITIDEATAVIEAARAAGKMATVFHNRRWDGDFVAIRDVVQSGILGEVFHIECAFGGYGEPRADWWRSYKEPSGGAFFDWGAHFVDWILQLMPYAIESVSGDFKKLKWQQVSNEDYTSAYIRFAGGRSAWVEQGNVNAIDKARWRILGTEGGLQKAGWDWEGKEGLKLVTFRNGQRVESTLPYGKSDWDGFYRNVADHLILGEPLAVTPESARDVIAILSLAEQSSKQGGMPLPLPYARS